VQEGLLDAYHPTLSSRVFNQDTSGAKRAAADVPVVITDRGVLAHMLLRYGDYLALTGGQMSLIDQLGLPEGMAEVALEIPALRDGPVAAIFD
jgi:hypothetical protein